MKNGFKYYLVCWAGFLALFNIVSFVTPQTIGGADKFEGGFWPGYVLITLGFILHLLSAKHSFDYKDKWDRSNKTTLLIVNTIELIIIIVCGLLFMFLPNAKDWVAIVCGAVLVVIDVALYFVIKGTTEHASLVNRKQTK